MPPPPLSTEANWKIPASFWLAALFWGTSFLWIKIGLENWDPVSLVTFRLGVASLFFAATLLASRQKFRVFLPGSWILPLVAFLNPYVPFLLISWAEQSIDTGMAAVLNATVPLFTLLLAPLFLPDEKPTWQTTLGALIGFSGIVILFGVPRLEMLSEMKGQFAVILACLCYALSTILLRRYGPNQPAIVQAALINVLALAWVFAHGLLIGGLKMPPGSWNWMAVGWLGALGSFAAYSLAMYVFVRRGATYMSFTNLAYPLLGVLLGIVVLGEPFEWRIVGGGTLVIGGIALVQLQKVRRARK